MFRDGQAWLPARTYVAEAVASRLSLDGSGQIMKLRTACPWKDHLYDLEAELALPDPIKFVIYEACPILRHSHLENVGHSCLSEHSRGSGRVLTCPASFASSM